MPSLELLEFEIENYTYFLSQKIPKSGKYNIKAKYLTNVL